MSIRVIDEPDILLTRSEYERLRREWESEQQYTTAPTSFETWLRNRRRAKRADATAGEFLPNLTQGDQ